MTVAFRQPIVNGADESSQASHWLDRPETSTGTFRARQRLAEPVVRDPEVAVKRIISLRTES